MKEGIGKFLVSIDFLACGPEDDFKIYIVAIVAEAKFRKLKIGV